MSRYTQQQLNRALSRIQAAKKSYEGDDDPSDLGTAAALILQAQPLLTEILDLLGDEIRANLEEKDAAAQAQ